MWSLYLVMLCHSAVKRSNIPILCLSSPAQKQTDLWEILPMTQKIDFPACLVCVYSEGPECQANNVQSSNICLRSDHRPKREISTSQNRIAKKDSLNFETDLRLVLVNYGPVFRQVSLSWLLSAKRSSNKHTSKLTYVKPRLATGLI